MCALLACASAALLVSCGPASDIGAITTHPRASLLAASTPTPPVATAGCGRRPPAAAGTSTLRHLTASGHERLYLLHVPLGYKSTHTYPLVLSFHGHGSSAERQQQMTGFSRLADTAAFIVAYPQGLVGPDGRTGWASGGLNRPHVDDVRFVGALVATLEDQLCVNPRRVYAMGFSNGGGMTYVLACTMADRFAAFASVSGAYVTPSAGCHPGRPVSFLEIHGTSDAVVPYTGRTATDELSVTSWLATWARLDDCSSVPTVTNLGSGVLQLTWAGCSGGASVVHYRLSGGVHIWPAVTDRTSGELSVPRNASAMPVADTALNISALIWSFFSSHELAPATAAPQPGTSGTHTVGAPRHNAAVSVPVTR